MDIINKTARYIYSFYGSQDYGEKVSEYSSLLAFIINEREDIIKKVLTYTIEQYNI